MFQRKNVKHLSFATDVVTFPRLSRFFDVGFSGEFVPMSLFVMFALNIVKPPLYFGVYMPLNSVIPSNRIGEMDFEQFIEFVATTVKVYVGVKARCAP